MVKGFDFIERFVIGFNFIECFDIDFDFMDNRLSLVVTIIFKFYYKNIF